MRQKNSRIAISFGVAGVIIIIASLLMNAYISLANSADRGTNARDVDEISYTISNVGFADFTSDKEYYTVLQVGDAVVPVYYFDTNSGKDCTNTDVAVDTLTDTMIVVGIYSYGYENGSTQVKQCVTDTNDSDHNKLLLTSVSSGTKLVGGTQKAVTALIANRTKANFVIPIRTISFLR